MNVDAKNIMLLFFITGVTAAAGLMFAKAPPTMVLAVTLGLVLFPGTRLNRAIGYYFAVCLVATLTGYMFGRVRGLTGIFFVLKYFEYFIVFFMAVSQIK